MEEKEALAFNKKFRFVWATRNRYSVISGGRGGEATGRIANATKHFEHKTSEKLIKNHESGVDILFRGIKTSSGNQTANLKSINGITTWIIEEAEELVDEDIFDKIDNSIRKKGIQLRVIIIWNPTNKKHWIWNRFFKENGVDYDFTGEKGDYTYVYSDYTENYKNLADSFLKKAKRMKEMRPKKYRNIYKGEPTDDVENALWKQSTMIDPFRIRQEDVPDLKRIVVGLDPNVSNKKDTASEPGIVVSGMDFQNPPHYYVLKDASEKMTPLEWARVSVGQYKNYSADAIVAEVNNGGDLVVDTIKNVTEGTHDTINVLTVRATRDKVVRAEPVSSIYEQGRVHHVGTFEFLEDEMTTYVGDPSEASPGRFDALVWSMTELAGLDKAEPSIRSL